MLFSTVSIAIFSSSGAVALASASLDAATASRRLIASKAQKVEAFSDFLKSVASRDLQSNTNPALYDGTTGFDFDGPGTTGQSGNFDLGDLDLSTLDICGKQNEKEFLGAKCGCKMTSFDGKEYEGLMDVVMDINNILESGGMQINFGCKMPTFCDTAIGVDECSAIQVDCTLDVDTEDFFNSSFDCDTCVRYDHPPGNDGKPDESRTSIMTGHTLCLDVDMCPPPVKEGKSIKDSTIALPFDFDSTNLFCGCTAELDGKECECALCPNLMGGVQLTCNNGSGEIKSECEDTGLEFVDVSDLSSLTQVKFSPQFSVVESDAVEIDSSIDGSKTGSSSSATASFGSAYLFFVAILGTGTVLISFLAY